MTMTDTNPSHTLAALNGRLSAWCKPHTLSTGNMPMNSPILDLSVGNSFPW